jgi:hypothetical protein
MSYGSTLVAGDSNGQPDLFVRVTCAGVVGCTPATTRVSLTRLGAQSNGNVQAGAAISATGRYVAFDSGATDLTADANPNGRQRAYVRDTCVGATGCTPRR